MNQNELKKLEQSLTRSAKKAKKYWVRGMVGLTESDQGFFPITVVPVTNPIQSKETTLEEVLADIGTFYTLFKEYKESNEKEKTELKTSIEDLQKQIDTLNETIKEIVEVI